MDHNTLTQAMRHAAMAKMHLDLLADNIGGGYAENSLAEAINSVAGVQRQLDRELADREKAIA